MSREQFTITIEADGEGAPIEIRLRHLLKIALRTCHLKCVNIEETTNREAAGAQAAITEPRRKAGRN